jgi:SSS family solute:Na+ symporter
MMALSRIDVPNGVSMGPFDWTLVVLINGAIIVYALLRSQKSESSSDWYLGGRSVPWWIVGLSAFATAIDSSDIVADAGGVYSLGMGYFVTNWVGTVVGWVLLAHFVALPMYKAGMYTNSEYLEARFGPATRVLSSLVQVQYRTMVMANISTTLFLTFAVVGGLGNAAWWVVVLVVLLSLSYTIWGGSSSVAWTDAAQSAVMIAASLILFFVVWNAVGGWAGLESRLGASDPALAARLLHLGGGQVKTVDTRELDEAAVTHHLLLGGDYDHERQTITRQTPAWLACLSFVMVGMAYSIVNHEQSMRLFAARSAWDMKMSVVVAGLLLVGITFFNLMVGIMGRSLFPTLESLPVEKSLQQTADALYPVMIRDYALVGLKGIIISGLLAAAISTYAGMGAAMSALLTRDVYARLIAPNRDDRHYLWMGRCLTVAVALGSFLYVPFLLKQGMMMFYLNLVSAFVAPLLTVFLMGVFTPAHRVSGTIGLVAGMAYGIWRMVAEKLAVEQGIMIMPPVMMNGYAAYPISVAITAGTMLFVSVIKGWEPVAGHLRLDETGWLKQSQLQAAHMESPIDRERSNLIPVVLGLVLITLGLVLSFVVFW